MAVPRIDPSVRYVGVSKLRVLNAEALRTLEGALVIQDNGEPLVVIVTFDKYLKIQEELQKADSVRSEC